MTHTLRILTSIHEVPEAAWDALLTDRSSPFLEWQWLACLEDSGSVGDGTGWLPRPFALYEGERLVAAAPAYVKLHSEGEFVFDWSWADAAAQLGVHYYPKLVFAVPFTPATGDRILVDPALAPDERAQVISTVADAAWRLCGELELSSSHALFVPDDEAHAWSHARYLERHGLQFHWKNQGFTNFEGFLATLPSKKRTQVRRERAQLARDGVEIRTARPEELTRELAREMHALYLTTVDKFVHGRRYLTVRFFELVAERFAGRLAWALARKDGALVASAFNVKGGGVLYGRYWGTHVDLPFLHFNVCVYHGIEEAIREGLHTFEPGAGGEHKRLRGFRPTLTRSMHRVGEPRLARLVEPFLARERAAIARHLEQDAEG